MAKKKTSTEILRKLQKGRLRRERISDGAYDGRFSPKVIPNKKKKANKNACRKNK